jgi:phenylalanyl-tRNA synthetase beta chain
MESRRGIIDVLPYPFPEPPQITLIPKKANRILGTEISPAGMADYFERLGLKIDSQTQEKNVVTVPSHRRDLKEEIDLVEELARIHGYDKIPETLPAMNLAEGKGKSSFYQEPKSVLF